MPTFYDRFVECAERWPSNVALELQRRDENESCTYAELRKMAESVGQWVTESGLPRGSRLAILADNHHRWVAVHLGVIAAGCTVVPFDAALHSDQLTKLLNDSGCSVIFCDARHADVSHEAIANLNIGLVLMDPERAEDQKAGWQNAGKWLANLPAIFNHGPKTFRPAPAAAGDITSLLYTSG